MATNKALVKLKSEEDRESLEELLGTHGWVVLGHVLNELLEKRGRDVLTIEDPDRLIKAKREYDGARSIVQDIKRLKEILRLNPEG